MREGSQEGCRKSSVEQKQHTRRISASRRFSHETATVGPLRNHSGGLPERIEYKHPHPEAGLFHSQITQKSGPEKGHDMLTGVQSESLCDHNITGFHKDVTYCSPSTSSGKQKRTVLQSTAICSENTPAKIEANHFLLALQQLANNNNLQTFIITSTEISKQPKSLTTTMPTFDGKSEKFELFEDFFQTSLKIHNQLTEDDRITCFHSLMRRDALQTFKTLMAQIERTLEKS